MNRATPRIEHGGLVGWACISVLAALQGAAFIAGYPPPGEPQKSLGVFLVGLMILAWAPMLLASYYVPHKSFFFRGIRWVYTQPLFGGSPKWAFVWLTICTAAGILTVLRGAGIYE